MGTRTVLVENVENPWLDTANGLAPVYEKFSLNTDYSYRVCDNNGYAPAYCLDKSLAVTHAGKFGLLLRILLMKMLLRWRWLKF